MLTCPVVVSLRPIGPIIAGHALAQPKPLANPTLSNPYGQTRVYSTLGSGQEGTNIRLWGPRLTCWEAQGEKEQQKQDR